MADDVKVLPRSDIPEDNVCAICGKGPFKDLRGYINHMRPAHGVRYERKEQTAHALKYRLKESKDLEEISELKPWHKLAIIHFRILNRPAEEAGKFVNRAGTSVSDVANSEAGKKYTEELYEMMDDMPALLHLVFRSSLLGLAIEDANALGMAKQVNDYEFIHKFVQDHYKATGVVTDEKDQTAQQNILQIHFDGGSFDSPTIRTEHRAIEADVLDEESD